MENFEIYNARRPLTEFKEILMKRYEAFDGEGNIFECSFFQNTVDELLLYYEMSEQEILGFYEELFGKLREKNFVLVYLHSDEIEANVEQIKKERSDGNGNEMWYPLMLRYLNDTPYGKKHPFEGVADMAAHFRRRMGMEMRIIEKVIGEQSIVLQAKDYEIEDVARRVT